MTASLTGADKLTKQPQIHKVFVRHGGGLWGVGAALHVPIIREPLSNVRSRGVWAHCTRRACVSGSGSRRPRASSPAPTNAHTTIRTFRINAVVRPGRRAQAEDLGGHRGARFRQAGRDELENDREEPFAVSR